MPLTPDMRRSIDQIRDYLFGGGYPDPVSNAEQLSFLFFFYLVEGIDAENALKAKVKSNPPCVGRPQGSGRRAPADGHWQASLHAQEGDGGTQLCRRQGVARASLRALPGAGEGEDPGLAGRRLPEHEEDGAPAGAGGGMPFTRTSARSGCGWAVSAPPGRVGRRIHAPRGVSQRLNRIHQNKTPPSEKDGVCQRSEPGFPGFFVPNESVEITSGRPDRQGFFRAGAGRLQTGPLRSWPPFLGLRI